MTTSSDERLARIRHIQDLMEAGAETGDAEPDRADEPDAPGGPNDSDAPTEPVQRPRRRFGVQRVRLGRLVPRRRATRRTAIGVGALVVAVVVILVVTGTGIGGTQGRRAVSVPTVGFSPNAQNGASGAQQTGQAFLAAWQRGDLHAAASITDNPSAAYAALGAYRRDLDVSGLIIQPNGVGSAGWLTLLRRGTDRFADEHLVVHLGTRGVSGRCRRLAALVRQVEPGDPVHRAQGRPAPGARQHRPDRVRRRGLLRPRDHRRRRPESGQPAARDRAERGDDERRPGRNDRRTRGRQWESARHRRHDRQAGRGRSRAHHHRSDGAGSRPGRRGIGPRTARWRSCSRPPGTSSRSRTTRRPASTRR
jgi:hypothetical protein